VSATPVPTPAGSPAPGASTAGSPAAAVPASTAPVVPVPTPPVTSVPGTTMTATAFPPGSPNAVVISGFIATQLGQLTAAGDPAAQKAARLALVAGSPRTSANGPTTTAYQSAYAKELCHQAQPLLLRTAPLRVRLNLGVALGSITSNAPSYDFAPAVQQLMADPNSAVALWGLKAARPLVATAVIRLGGTGTDPIFGAIVKSVQSHPPDGFAGALAVDAYRALVVNTQNPLPNISDDKATPLLKVLYDPVMDLLVYRTGQFKAGMVPSPDAEFSVPTFLSKDYENMAPATKDREVQVLLNWMDACGQRAVLVPNANRPLLRDIAGTVKRFASALTVMYRVGDATHPKQDNAVPLDKVASLDLTATGTSIAAATATAFPALSARFPQLVKPPTLPPVAAQAAPLVVPPPVIAPTTPGPGAPARPTTPVPPTPGR
jgi:hypothetical protein